MNVVLDFLFPKRCVGCKQIGNYICASCIAKITQKALVCCVCKEGSSGGITHPDCQTKLSLDGVWSFGAYEGILRKAILKLKYKRVYRLAEELVDLCNIYFDLKAPYFLEKITKGGWIVVPVPLHKYRQNNRGFNQSAILAKSFAHKLGLDHKEILIRRKSTLPQVKLEAERRKQNIKDVFTLNTEYLIRNTNVLLIDDVWTTGATVHECVKLLKQAGIGKVWVITIAH